MTIPPIVTDMPPVEATRGKMPTTVLVICIIEGTFLLLSIGSMIMHYTQSEESKRKQARVQLEMQFEQMGLEGMEITESQIDQVISIAGYVIAFSMIPFTISILLFFGFCFGNRLAWYFYRTLGLLGAILVTFSIFQLPLLINSATRTNDPQLYVAIVSMVFSIVYGWVIYFLLGTESAREFFGAICPTCRFKKIKPLDFFATKVSCKSCGTEWT